MVPAFLTVGSGANSLTVTLGNIHCIQRLTFPLLPPMLLVFCSRVTVSANGPSSPGGTESPWRDKEDLVKELGWCDALGKKIHQHQPVRSKRVYACMTVLTRVGRADQGWADRPKGFWQRFEGDSSVFCFFYIYIYLILFSCKSVFQTSFCVVSSPREKSCNLTIWNVQLWNSSILNSPQLFLHSVLMIAVSQLSSSAVVGEGVISYLN